jgi:hypothetical protein
MPLISLRQKIFSLHAEGIEKLVQLCPSIALSFIIEKAITIATLEHSFSTLAFSHSIEREAV